MIPVGVNNVALFLLHTNHNQDNSGSDTVYNI